MDDEDHDDDDDEDQPDDYKKQGTGHAIKAILGYNVSEILREQFTSDTDMDKLNTFIMDLDKKVHIDASDPRYSHIYRGIDIIMNRLVSELTKADSCFAEAKLRHTVSIYSNVKVGLPHETDYLLEVPDNRKMDIGDAFENATLFDMVLAITEQKKYDLTDGLTHWVIHGVEHNRNIGGICLTMQCPSDEGCSDSEEVGVTVDLVPAYIVKSKYEKLNGRASVFLPYNLQEYADKGELYRLLDREECDTGLIENQIMKQLTENKKRVFRVLKFLNQNVHVGELNGESYNNYLDGTTRLRLYGYKPSYPSYLLRVVFFHLLLGVHGTKAEEELTDGRLLKCFINLLHYFAKKDRDYIKHPFILKRRIYMNLPRLNWLPMHVLEDIDRMLQKEISGVSLQNSKVGEIRHLKFNENKDGTEFSLVNAPGGFSW